MLSLLARWADAYDVPRQVDALETSDEPCTGVDPPAPGAVPR